MRKLAVMVGFLIWTDCMAGLPPAPTPDEIRLLPPYCAAKLNNNAADDAQYITTIGPDWAHLHHYCFALNFTNRYYRLFGDRNEQRTALNDALNNYDYMLTHVTPNFWLLPEMLSQKAKLLASAKRYADALGALQKAIQLNPKYPEAYVVLSDVYRSMDQKDKALAAVEQGLQYTPDKVSLQKRYKQLTGKTFIPPPAAQQDTQEAPAVESAASPPPAADPPASEESAVPAEPPVEPPPAAEPKVKIGTPDNPYCRFCP